MRMGNLQVTEKELTSQVNSCLSRTQGVGELVNRPLLAALPLTIFNSN